MIDFLNTNLGLVQSLTAIILVLITMWYSYKTHIMATIMARQFELSNIPYAMIGEDIEIVVQQVGTNPNVLASKTGFVQFIFIIKNIGNTPIKYYHYISFESENSRSEIEVIVYPGQIMRSTSKEFIIPPTEPQQLRGISNVKIVYWSLSNPNVKYFFDRKFNLTFPRYNIIEDRAGREN